MTHPRPDFGSKEAASQGGKARSKALSKAEKSDIARRAAGVRWAGKNKGTRYAVREAPLSVGAIEMECAVLDDETRVLSERAFSRAIGAKRGGSHWQRQKRDPSGAYLPVFISAPNLKPFISLELASALADPIVYTPRHGAKAFGIRAELIPQILDVWLKARDAKALRESQEPFAKVAEILMRGLAATGIVALIDEATGFQAFRDQNALAKFLEQYIAKELRQWIPTFPLSFFKELCRLRGIPFRDDMRLPQYFGHFVNDLVYSRLAPGVREELDHKNPVQENGRRKNKKFQWLTEGIGNPKLLHHLGLVEGIGRGYADGEWDAFYSHVDRAAPRFLPMPLWDAARDAGAPPLMPPAAKGQLEAPNRK